MAVTPQALIKMIESLPPQQLAEVEDFVEFLTAKASRRAALDRLLAIAPALEAAGATPISEEEIVAEVKAARAERRARLLERTKEPGADLIVSGDADLLSLGTFQGIPILTAAQALERVSVRG